MRKGVWGVLVIIAFGVTACTSATEAPTPTLASVTVAPPATEPEVTQPLPTGYPAPELPSPTPGTTTGGYPLTVTPAPDVTAVPPTAPSDGPTAAGSALKFFGTGRGDVDRVKIKLDAPAVPADIGSGDFTIEFWLKAVPGENASTSASCGSVDGWITGNIVVDRDIWGGGDFGDFGLSLAGGRVVFGIAQGSNGTTVCGQASVADEAWHHIAVTRSALTGRVQLFVDGRADGEGMGPTGDISYRDGRGTGYANDPYLVFGAEKHDYDSNAYPSFRGWLDEARLSNVIRYTADFARPSSPFRPDAETVALWHFDEGAGEVVSDSTPDGKSPGQVTVGGSNNGPQWVASDAPLTSAP